ncbi:MAG TPA: hypothetical protein VG755_24875 [Nannocystaceae bacterium]|nr:hypothetical protein [Nannocystaceae bacterium]
MKMAKWVGALVVLSVAACRDGGAVSNESTSSSDDGGSDVAPTTTTPTSATDTTAADTTTGDVAEPYGGVWCGNASTGALALGPMLGVIEFHGAAASPVPIVGWADDTGQIMVARYDVASASWSDPDVVATDFPYTGIEVSRPPVGAVSPSGDAWIAYGMSTPEPHVVVHRYEMATQTWTREDLPDTFADPIAVGMVASSTGHAALFANDLQPDGLDGRTAVWFFDPDAAAWTAEPPEELEAFSAGESTRGASDATSGNIVLAKDGELGTLTMWRYLAASNEVVRDEVVTGGDDVEQVIALGNDAFVVVTRRSESDGPYELNAHHFDGTAWQPAVEIGSGIGLGGYRGLHIVGDVGRVGVGWTESAGAAFATTYTSETGWREPSMLQANEPMSPGAISSVRVALDEAGAFVMWAAIAAGKVTPRSSYFEAETWSTTAIVDPNQPQTYSDLKHLDALGPGRARAVWERHDELGGMSWVWACHTPSDGWSAPTSTAIVRRVDPRPAGEVLVVTVQGSMGSAEYFAAAE